MKKIVSIALLFVASFSFAQQQSMYSHYMFNTLSVNPAYAGSTKSLSANILHRSQWVGITGAPTTQTLIIQGPFKNKNIGLGATVMNDKIGPVSQLILSGDFAYKLNLNEKSNLAFGLKAVFEDVSVRLADVPDVHPNDPSFQNQLKSGFKPNFGFGLYYNSEKFYAGISTPNLIESSFSNSLVNYQHLRHFYAVAGGLFDLTSSLKLRPSMQVKYVENAPVSVDVNTYLIVKEKVWIGAMYRYSEAVGALLQYQINDQLRFGYAYDFILNELQSGTGGSHELILMYDFNYNKNNFSTPRFF
ncbi:MAG: type IX secretion system PorP/SprF family membrane protein [Flavobacteriales bacterium]|jgi:type IX secretion system PorP/SprF family membrane protein